MDLLARWKQLTQSLADKQLGWTLHHAPAHLRHARSTRHPRGATVEHLLPDDYRAFIAAVGYPVIGFSYYDSEGTTFLPPEPMEYLSPDIADHEDEVAAPVENAPTPCKLAFFAGYDLSDINGFAFGKSADSDAIVVWLVEGAVAREEHGSFTQWMTAEIARLAERVAELDADAVAELVQENDGETDPHRLIDYSLDKSYEVAPYSADDLALAWVEQQKGSPYSYGLIDGQGAWRIPLGKRFRGVRPFRDGVAEVQLASDDDDESQFEWVKIRPDGSRV